MPEDISTSSSEDSDHPNQPSLPRRGEIYYVDLNPIIDSEQGGRRPVLILQNDIGNQYSPVTIVAAITSRPSARLRPIDVPVQSGRSGLQAPSRIMLNQIRTIDRRRLERYVGQLTAEEMIQVEEAIKISFGLTPL